MAIPARNEAHHIGDCLEALANQIGGTADHVVVLVNNSTDNTADVARSVAFQPETKLHVLEVTLPGEQANAGQARRLAMQAGELLAGPTGILMTTDADGQVDNNWIAATLACFRIGVEAVAGWVELHPIDWGAIPAQLHEDDSRECAYDALCDEIHALLDPDASDPLPRHTQHSGASLAVTVEAYRRCGGIPALSCGEDRAFVAALRRVDARVRHAPEVHVTVSGRTKGRCQGGMADTIRRRLIAADEFLDERLEPAATCAKRARLRASLRQVYLGLPPDTNLTLDTGLPHADLATALQLSTFGKAWAEIEQRSPRLVRQRVAVAELSTEMGAATAILKAARRNLDPIATAIGIIDSKT